MEASRLSVMLFANGIQRKRGANPCRRPKFASFPLKMDKLHVRLEKSGDNDTDGTGDGSRVARERSGTVVTGGLAGA